MLNSLLFDLNDHEIHKHIHLTCNEPLIWQRHALLIGYFLSYAPQLLGFILFVLPSTSYLKEFRETSIAKTYLFKRILSQENNTKVITTSRNPDVASAQ